MTVNFPFKCILYGKSRNDGKMPFSISLIYRVNSRNDDNVPITTVKFPIISMDKAVF